MEKEVYFPSDWIMYQAAELFYNQGFSQREISSRLNVSTVTVSRLIQRAKESGVVRIDIAEPVCRALQISDRLKNKYHLRDVVVAQYPNSFRPDIPDEKHAVALEGARYLQRLITSGDIVGIAWGRTIYYLINYLNPCRRTDTSFITMHGSIANCDLDLDVQTLTTRAAMAMGGRKFCLYSDGLWKDARSIRKLVDTPPVRQIFGMYENISISVSSIGVHYPQRTSLLALPSYIDYDDYEQLRRADVCGDIMLRFFDRAGNECGTPIKDRTLSISLETYRKIQTKILVVSGTHKAYALDVALKQGFCDILVVSEPLGQALMANIEQGAMSEIKTPLNDR